MDLSVSRPLRVGIGISAADDPFWLQVHGAIYQLGNKFPVKLIPIHQGRFPEGTTAAYDAVLDEVVSQELDVLLGCNFPDFLASLVLDMGLPIVHLYETRVSHPLAVSPIGLCQIAEKLSHYLANILNRSGNILVIGGMLREDHPDDGRSRIAGIRTAFQQYPEMHFHHVQTDWLNDAQVSIRSQLANWTCPVDAIFGLSDSLALLGRKIAVEMGFCDNSVPVVGINGDPLALAAIIEGQMAATVETPAVNLARQAFDIAVRIATDQPYPAHYEFSPRLVTANNITTVTMQKMANITEISSYVINFQRGTQHRNEDMLKCSNEMSHVIAAATDLEELPSELACLIRARFGYDDVQVYFWSEREQSLIVSPDSYERGQARKFSLLDAGVLGEAITQKKLIFIPDCQRSLRYPPDPNYPDTRSRVIMPIRYGNRVLGLLDLHAFRVVYCPEQHLAGLQSLADQIGLPIYNAGLSRDVMQSKAAAEKAQQLKTLLLAGIRGRVRISRRPISAYSESPNAAGREISTSKRVWADAVRLLKLLDDLLEVQRHEVDESPFEYAGNEPEFLFSSAFDHATDAIAEIYSPPPTQSSAVVKDTIAYIQDNFHEKISRSELASAVGVSESYLTQIFRRVTRVSLWDYLARYRIHQAKKLLLQTNDSVADISMQVGFDDPAYFSRVFRRYVGQSPREFRNTSTSLQRPTTQN